MEKDVKHKYHVQKGHVCGYQKGLKFDASCCNQTWRGVTCKRCLKLKDKSK